MLLRKIFTLLAFAILVVLPSFSPLARTITVDDDGPADYSSIQEALNAISGADTVFVKAGTYYECGIVLPGTPPGDHQDIAFLKGEGADVTHIVGQVEQFFAKDWSWYSHVPIDRSNPLWQLRTFVVLQAEWIGLPMEGFSVGWEGEEKGIGILVSSGWAPIRRCKLTGNFAGMVLFTELSFPHRQIIQANTITGNEYGVIWDIGSMDYDIGFPGRADRNWWGTVVESEIRTGFVYTMLQYRPELEDWAEEEDMFRQACYPWLEGSVDIESFQGTDEDGVHYNNIHDNEINLATPVSPKLTGVSARSWGQIKSKMQ